MNQLSSQSFNQEQEKVLNSIRPSKIILPTIIGVFVVVFLVRRQVDLEEMMNINWVGASYFWILAAILVYVGRHLLYSWRLQKKVINEDSNH